jgi:hypothetical protein
MRRLLVIPLALAVGACGGAGSQTIAQDQVGSTEAAVAATPTGVADCGGYALPRRITQWVNSVESEALPDLIANPVDAACRFAVGTLLVSLPLCEDGAPADVAKIESLRTRVNAALESGLPPDQAYALIRNDARELAARKAC